MSVYIKPTAAFKKLDAAKLLNQNVYIYGATGFGKTELIRQYFKRDSYVYIYCSRNSCDLSVIPQESKHKITVVIDNVNSIENNDIRNAIKELCGRKKFWVIILGRSKMPSWLFDTFVIRNMTLIAEADLALSEDDIDKYMRSEDIILTRDELKYIRGKCEGNLFGVKYNAQRLLSRDKLCEKLFEENQIYFCNYLENNIISELSSEVSDFLMKISIVDDFTEQLAAIIMEDSSVLSLIERALDSGNFIEIKDGVYTLRRQMLNTLRRMAAKTFSEQQLQQYALLVGEYYESQGEDNKALEMYARYNESDRIRELLVRNSKKAVASGYYIEMRNYYLMFSDEDIRSNAYLMSAMSMLYSMLLDLDKSEYWYNELKKYKETVKGSKQREATSLIAYLDISLPGRGSINILELIKDYYTLLSQDSIPMPEFSVTSNIPSLMNGSKDFCDWSRHDRKIAATAGNIITVFLGKHGKGLINAALAESFFEKGGDPYEIMSLISRAKIEAEASGNSELTFAATGTLFRQYIILGEPDNAKTLLSSYESKAKKEQLKRLYPSIEAMKCRLALIEGDNEAAALWLKTAPDENVEFIAFYRYLYLTKIRCYISFEQYDRAYSLIEAMKFYAEHCDRKYILMELGILTAIIRFRTGEAWKNDFAKVLEQICEYQFIPILTEYSATVYNMLYQLDDICEENKKINHKWFERIRSESGRVARHYPLYLKRRATAIPKLQPMDIRVLTCLANGLSIQETAKRLSINYETLRSRIKEIYRKLGAQNKTEAVLIARETKII